MILLTFVIFFFFLGILSCSGFVPRKRPDIEKKKQATLRIFPIGNATFLAHLAIGKLGLIWKWRTLKRLEGN